MWAAPPTTTAVPTRPGPLRLLWHVRSPLGGRPRPVPAPTRSLPGRRRVGIRSNATSSPPASRIVWATLWAHTFSQARSAARSTVRATLHGVRRILVVEQCDDFGARDLVEARLNVGIELGRLHRGDDAVRVLGHECDVDDARIVPSSTRGPRLQVLFRPGTCSRERRGSRSQLGRSLPCCPPSFACRVYLDET